VRYGALGLVAAALGSACGDSFEQSGDARDGGAGTSGSAGTGSGGTNATGGTGATGGEAGSTSGGAGGKGATGGSTGSGGVSGSAGASGGASGSGVVDAATDARPPLERDCTVDGGASDAIGPDPERREQTRGVNGEFVDACNSDGNLMEFFCEVKVECEEPPNPVCVSYQSGKVTSQLFDCGGKCANGECNARCPAIGDVLIYESLGDDGAAGFKFVEAPRHFQCTLLFDNPNDSYDCKTSPQIGQEVEVQSLGLSGPFCTGGAIGNIGLLNCSYACSIVG
jgi:hypothetical protein